MTRRVLVTGATGFVGSALARAMGERGLEVHALARPSADRRAVDGADVVWHAGDLIDAVSVERAVAALAGGGAFHRFVRNGQGTYLEELKPGGDRTLVEDPDSIRLIGRVAGFYRRMDEVAAVNLTQH